MSEPYRGLRLITEIPETREEMQQVVWELLHRGARERNFRQRAAAGESLDCVEAGYFLGICDDLRFVLEHFAREKGFEVPSR